MNFNIITLGCKVNQYESQAMREDMLKNGFLLSDDRDRADITIVNSCTVTSVSDAKTARFSTVSVVKILTELLFSPAVCHRLSPKKAKTFQIAISYSAMQREPNSFLQFTSFSKKNRNLFI